jgi:hypothetical protein
LIKIEDINDSNFNDVFQVCSIKSTNDQFIQKGTGLKRAWIKQNLEKYGPFTKIAYLDLEPVAQIMFYPEIAVPYIKDPRSRVIEIICAYRVKEEAQGAGTLLLKNLINEAKTGIKCLHGQTCEFLVAAPFNTGEGTSLRQYYLDNGFQESDDELYLELNGKYYPRPRETYENPIEDNGKAYVFYDMNCEYSWRFASNIDKIIQEIDDSLEIKKINRWTHPLESIKRGNSLVSVNGRVIKSYWQSPEFKEEVREALNTSA